MNHLITQIRLWVPRLKVWMIIPDLLAVLALLIALGLGDTLWPTVAMLAVIALITHRQRDHIFTTRAGAGGLASYLVARYMLLAAVAARLFSVGGFTGPEAGILGCAAVLLAAERVVRAGNTLVVPPGLNLPKLKLRLRDAFPYRLLFVVNMGLALVMAVNSQFTGILQPVEILLVVAALVLTARALGDVAARLRSCHAVALRRRKALERIKPAFYLYWDAVPGGLYQAQMWIPFLDRLGQPYVIIVRRAASARALARHTKRPIVLCESIDEIDSVIVDSARGVFYVNNAVRNAQMVWYSRLLHIQLNHGESDKAASVSPVFRMYDLNFVAGQGAIDRFTAAGVHVRPDYFRIVGRPQVAGVEVATAPVGRVARPTVLYAPTWSGFQDDADYTSLHVGEEIVRGLLQRGCRVVFRPHPFAVDHEETAEACRRIDETLAAHARSSGTDHIYGAAARSERGIFECFNLSDAMIADVSSVVGDYLYSRKPFAMVATRHDAAGFEAAFPTSRAAYIIEVEGRALIGLDAALDSLLDADPKRGRREELATYYLGDFPPETYADEFVRTARAELGLA